MNIFTQMDGLQKAEDVQAKDPMSEDYAQKLGAKLKKDGRSNVYCNKYDKNKPYRVSVKKKDTFHSFGLFVNIDAAAAVGTIAGMSLYGSKAIMGVFDQAKAEASPEFQAWMADEQNEATIKAVMG